MPITFHFRPEAKLVVCVPTGTKPDDEFLASYKALFENNLFDKSMNRLIDLRQSYTPQRSSDVLYQLAEFVRKQYTENRSYPKIAVVAPTDLAFGISRIYEVFAADVPWNFVVFRAADVALAWLGLLADFIDDLNMDTQQ